MTPHTPEELAKQFARRWLSHESPSLREQGERELVQVIRAAIDQQQSDEENEQAA